MKKLIIFVTLPLLLIVGAGMGAVLFGLIPGFDPLGTQKAADSASMAAKEAEEKYLNEAPPPFLETDPNSVVFQLEEFVINLQTEARYPVFMLLSVAVELSDPSAQVRVSSLEPRLRDAIIIFASRFHKDDLQGFEGINRMRDGLWLQLREIIAEEDLLNVQVIKMTIK